MAHHSTDIEMSCTEKLCLETTTADGDQVRIHQHECSQDHIFADKAV